jgi:pSer/pThr/pTyr-binding forkhead associated (FHA) protein
MAITIKHREGPLAGQVQEFDDAVELISFGRSPECQVVYPPELTEVGRKHLELRRVGSGDYVVELSGRHYVEIDGTQAESGSRLTSASVVRLERNGPTSW